LKHIEEAIARHEEPDRSKVTKAQDLLKLLKTDRNPFWKNPKWQQLRTRLTQVKKTSIGH
jgi:hypothetical protein